MERKILLVEDNPDDVKLTLRALQRNHIANPVDVVGDGVEALDYLFGRGDYADRAGAPLPDVVLLDLKLPRLDGIGVLRAAREHPRTRTVPIVILTTSAEESDIAAGYAHGANSYVRKPVDFAAFIDAARTLGLYWLVVNEPPRQGNPL